MQYFASFESFEIFDEFNGVKGTYIKSFLISDVINLNKWQATHESNLSNLDTFLGRPGIHYINPETKKRDHTSATSFEKSLQIQELYRAASIIAVGSDIATRKNWQISKMMDPEVTAKIKTGEIKWISPSIWPKEGAVEVIEQTDGETVDVVHDYVGLHYAFVDEPAFGDEASIKPVCDGTTKQCLLELKNFVAAIDNVMSITEHKIIKGKEKQNTSKDTANTSHKINSSSEIQMATEEEKLRKELEDAKKALKATEEELEKEKAESSKKGNEDEDEKEKESKKGTDDDKEKEELKARIAVLEKQPIVEKIISAELSAGIISKDDVSVKSASLLKESKESLSASLETVKAFSAKLKSVTPTEPQTIPYMGSVSDDNDQFVSFDASVDNMDLDELMEVSN